MPVTQKQLANLKSFTKERRCNPKSPGRPPTRGLAEMIRKDYAKDPAATVRLIKKRKMDLYLSYGFGKPTETLNIGGIPGQPLQVDITSGMTVPEMKARLAAIKAKGTV